MANITQVSYFILTAYFDTGPARYFLFLFVMSLYGLTVIANTVLIVVICANRSLHEPMYMFLCSLFVNELYGSTGLFPFLLLQILSDVHTVHAPLCFLQIFCVYMYTCTQFSNLAAISYDRYLAVCFPLQYHTLMTSRKVLLIIAVSWLYSLVGVGILISLSVPLQLCWNRIPKVYCDNYSIVKMSCTDTTVNNIYGLCLTASVLLLVLLILYSYLKILQVCVSGRNHAGRKALSTCVPHLASLVNFSCGVFFEVLRNRFQLDDAPNMLRIFLSVYFLTCSPLLNPLLYGLKLNKIRTACKNVIRRQM